MCPNITLTPQITHHMFHILLFFCSMYKTSYIRDSTIHYPFSWEEVVFDDILNTNSSSFSPLVLIMITYRKTIKNGKCLLVLMIS